MTMFMTATEIATLGLPDIPTTRRRVREMAISKEWVSRPNERLGGGREYAISSLPLTALAELRLRETKAEAESVQRDDPRFEYCADEKASARTAIVLFFNKFFNEIDLPRTRAIKIFVERYATEKDFCPPWVRLTVPSLGARTLRRWLTTASKDGLKALEDRQRGPKGQSRFDTDLNLRTYIVAQIAGRPHVAATHIYAGIQANFTDAPSLRSVQNYVRDYRKANASELLYAADPDTWKSHRRTAFGSMSSSILRLNQKWEIDGTIADVRCVGPDGNQTRYSLVGLIDVFSRRAKVLVTEQPSAVATAACLRSAILDWGLPEVLKADNGKDYTAEHVGRIAHDLGFTIDYCTPFSPEQKPHVERFFGTLTRELFETLPHFAGHSVADQQAIRARKSMAQRHGAARTSNFSLGPGELQIVINSWLADIYERREHAGIKTTPFQKAIGQSTRKIESERALDMLLAPPAQGGGFRKVQKKGVSVHGHWFIAPEIGGMVGQPVSVRLDLEDPGRIFLYDAEDGAFLCIAEDPTQTGADQQAIALRAQQVQKTKLSEIRAQQRAATAAHNPDRLASDILGHAAQSASKVTPLRAPYIAASTPSLNEAAAAADRIDNGPAQPSPLSDDLASEATEAIRQLEATTAAKNKPSLTVYHADPTQRPIFALGMAGDVDFYKWASRLQDDGLLDDETTAELAELEGDHTFQLHLLSLGETTQEILKAKGMYR